MIARAPPPCKRARQKTVRAAFFASSAREKRNARGCWCFHGRPALRQRTGVAFRLPFSRARDQRNENSLAGRPFSCASCRRDTLRRDVNAVFSSREKKTSARDDPCTHSVATPRRAGSRRAGAAVCRARTQKTKHAFLPRPRRPPVLRVLEGCPSVTRQVVQSSAVP